MVFEKVALITGQAVLVLGGAMLASTIIGFLGWLLCIAWVAFSEAFRPICKGEKLIFEYRKNREKFLEWRASHE